ncbi:MAG: Na/Pi cotransporter family protein [Deltaproteobacteria bacterium]|nr:Na/Pi cotransporter family protein [Deltaproteobacteria bacterium]
MKSIFSSMRNSGIKIVSAVVLFSIAATSILHASQGGSERISWSFLFIGLLGGLAFFLYGIEKMSIGMKKTAGDQMRKILSALTKNRVVALFVGAFVTMVIQSSSATTAMLVSFVNAQLMTFTQSIGVIFGAGIGTTITAQLIAFKLADYALLMIVAGFSMHMFAKKEYIKNIGDVILGFGILFYGMKLMSDSMKPLRTYPEFVNLMQGLENPFLGIFVGTVFTAVIQSSSAFIGIIIVLAQQGLVSLDAGIPLILGANIGTCVTAVFASIGSSREAKRVAMAHVLFRVAGVLLFFFWIPQFSKIIKTIALHFNSDVTRQIANAHTLFNVSVALIFLPFTMIFANLITKILPDKEDDKAMELTTWHLDDNVTSTPALAIDLARVETSRMAKLLGRMLRSIIIPFMSDVKLMSKEILEKDELELFLKEIPKQDEIFPQLTLLEGIDMREEKIDFLEEKIGEYLVSLARQNLTDSQASEVYGMISIIKDMESIGDIIHRNVVPLIKKKQALEMDFSKEGKEELMIYHEKVCRQIFLLRDAFAERNLETARKIMSGERKYLDLESKYRILHLERILYNKKESIETHEVHMELMDLLKQIIVYSSNIAKTFFRTCGKEDLERWKKA